jgi:cytochrome c biogenesis protein CcdA
MVAAFNPCGFALLPAYITVLITGSASEGVTRPMAVRRALLFGLAMTTGFMVVFTAFGLLFGAVNLGLQGSILPYVSYVTAALGVLLIWLGVVLLRGGQLNGPGLRLNSAQPAKSFWSQTVYGASFAVASLSCTIGLFLAVVTQALAATNPVGAVAPFVVYAAGMGTSILIVSLLAALAGAGLAAGLRRHTPRIMRAGGGLMIVAGLYVLVFGLAEILPRYGVSALNSVLTTTARWQGDVSQWIESWGTPALITLVVIVTIVVVSVFMAGRRTTSVPTGAAGSSPPDSHADALGSGSAPNVAAPDTLASVRDAMRKKNRA